MADAGTQNKMGSDGKACGWDDDVPKQGQVTKMDEHASTDAESATRETNTQIETAPSEGEVAHWEDLSLSLSVLQGIYEFGFETPSSIQRRALPAFLKNCDVLAQSQSGTGKTGAFVVGTLQSMLNKKCNAFVVEPTRELVTQTASVAASIAHHCDITVIEASANVSLNDNLNAIRKARGSGRWVLVISTPGRAVRLVEKNYDLACNVGVFVLDEADELLAQSRNNRSFKDDIQHIVAIIPKTCQICMFSATLPQQAEDMAAGIMVNRVDIRVKVEDLTLEGIKQFYIDCEQDRFKASTVCDLFETLSVAQTVIFASTKARVDRLHNELERAQMPVMAIHGDMTGEQRNEAMDAFRNGRCRVLVASTLLARGIDVQQVSCVMLYDVPKDFETYLHAVGRSGRYGRKGVAILLVTSHDAQQLGCLQSFYQTHIEEMPANIQQYL